jgi:hypothetical protein
MKINRLLIKMLLLLPILGMSQERFDVYSDNKKMLFNLYMDIDNMCNLKPELLKEFKIKLPEGKTLSIEDPLNETIERVGYSIFYANKEIFEIDDFKKIMNSENLFITNDKILKQVEVSCFYGFYKKRKINSFNKRTERKISKYGAGMSITYSYKVKDDCSISSEEHIKLKFLFQPRGKNNK